MPQRDRAISYLRKQGLLGDVARGLRVSKQATSKWRRVPAGRVLAVAQITGLTVHYLRPDLYPASLQNSPGRLRQNYGKS